jgi:hypothetical protein
MFRHSGWQPSTFTREPALTFWCQFHVTTCYFLLFLTKTTRRACIGRGIARARTPSDGGRYNLCDYWPMHEILRHFTASREGQHVIRDCREWTSVYMNLSCIYHAHKLIFFKKLKKSIYSLFIIFYLCIKF